MAPRSLLGLLLVLVVSPVAAQHYPLRSFGVQENVGHVRSLSFDHDGYLWLGTSRGLLRFDGLRFVIVMDTPVSRVAAGPDGALWTWAGSELLWRKGVGHFFRISAPEHIAHVLEKKEHGHIQLFPTEDGRLVLLETQSGLWLFDPESNSWSSILRVTEGDRMRSYAAIDGDEAWVLTKSHLGRMRIPRDGEPERVKWLSSVDGGRHVLPHPEGAWVMANDGLHIYRDDGSFHRVIDPMYRSWFTIPDVAADGTLAVTVEGPTGKALHITDPGGSVRHRLSTENGMRTTSLDAVRFDDEGGLWMASEHGLDHLEDRDRLVAFTLGTAGVTNLRVEPGTGVVWAGTYDGLFRFAGTGFERIGAERAAMAPDFAPDGTGHWIEFGGAGDAFRRWSNHWNAGTIGENSLVRHYRATLPDGRSIFERRTGHGGTGSYALVTEDDHVLVEDTAIGAFVVGAPPRRRVWLALNERLDTIEEDGLGSRSASTPPSVRRVIEELDGLGIRRMEIDSFGRIWLATLRGLGVLFETTPDDWQLRLFGREDGLTTEKVIGLDVGQGERLWLGTDRGVLGFTLHDEEPWLRPVSLASLNAALPTEVVLDLREDGEGALWVAPVGVRTLYRYAWRTVALPSPAVRMTGIEVNDRPLTSPVERLRTFEAGHRGEDATLRFRADTTRLTLAFAPRTLRRLPEVTYQYRLLGLDTAWVDLQDVPSVQFAHLGPGRYTFEARAIRAGQPPGPDLAVRLHLVPPFYRSGWFVALCTLVLIGAAMAGAWRRARRAEERAAELETIVAQRTAALEAEKRTTEQQAERLVALDEAKSRFFANISHEFRTPLTLMLGPLRDAATGRSNGEALNRHLPLMRRSGERLLGLVDQLLDLARLDAGRLRLSVAETDIAGLSRRIVLAFASRAEREGLALNFEASPRRLMAWIDTERYEQILSNLLTNAFKFTPTGGRVRVTIGVADGDAVLTVRDTGEGIAAEELPHVFDRFHRAEAVSSHHRQGAGIGLALVHELVALHGGTVAVESTQGFGSLFTVRLPLGKDHFEAEAYAESPMRVKSHAPSVTVDTEDEQPEPETARTDATVLFIDDHADMRSYLRSLLQPQYTVEEAEDGRAGLDMARRLVSEGRPPDLIISDVMMPGIGGYALCREIKEDEVLGHIPVVLLTARADEEGRLEGLGEGADDYLAKPFSPDELLARCENLIEVRRRLRARFSGEVVVRPTEVVVPIDEVDWLEEVRNICEAHLSEAHFGVDWLADELHLSVRQLRRRLKQASGLSPGAFLRTMRLERAAQLLMQGSRGVADVAVSVGYTDAESFSRAFRQGFGMPPSAYAGAADDDA